MIGSTRRSGRLPLVGVLIAGVAVALAGCLGDSNIDDETIVIFGPYRDVEADRFAESLEEFTDSTGIDVRYTGTSDFVGDVTARIENSGETPDVAIVPQPGLVQSMVDTGALIPLEPRTSEALRKNYDPDIADAAMFDGIDYAVPFRRAFKSIVWYRPDVFEAQGWEIPRTLDELESLSERIAESEQEIAPWCFSLQAGGETGWPATDWVEDLIVRRAGVDVYDDWVEGSIGFGDPRIEDAFEEFAAMVLAPGRVAGRMTAVAATPVELAWEPLLAAEPGCAMYKQADFALDWMPDVAVGPDGDVDWFTLPGVTEDEPPLLLGGDLIVALEGRAEVAALMDYLAGISAGLPWVEEGGFLSAKSTIAAGAYPAAERDFIEVLDDASVQVFDGSDRMPPSIGSDLLWNQISQWVTGAIDYDEFAELMDEAREADDES